ncbi:hypothetical protein BJX99DRAFT_231256 [Aspergillus californicus]
MTTATRSSSARKKRNSTTEAVDLLNSVMKKRTRFDERQTQSARPARQIRNKPRAPRRDIFDIPSDSPERSRRPTTKSSPLATTAPLTPRRSSRLRADPQARYNLVVSPVTEREPWQYSYDYGKSADDNEASRDPEYEGHGLIGNFNIFSDEAESDRSASPSDLLRHDLHRSSQFEAPRSNAGSPTTLDVRGSGVRASRSPSQAYQSTTAQNPSVVIHQHFHHSPSKSPQGFHRSQSKVPETPRQMRAPSRMEPPTTRSPIPRETPTRKAKRRQRRPSHLDAEWSEQDNALLGGDYDAPMDEDEMGAGNDTGSDSLFVSQDEPPVLATPSSPRQSIVLRSGKSVTFPAGRDPESPASEPSPNRRSHPSPVVAGPSTRSPNHQTPPRDPYTSLSDDERHSEPTRTSGGAPTTSQAETIDNTGTDDQTQPEHQPPPNTQTQTIDQAFTDQPRRNRSSRPSNYFGEETPDPESTYPRCKEAMEFGEQQQNWKTLIKEAHAMQGNIDPTMEKHFEDIKAFVLRSQRCYQDIYDRSEASQGLSSKEASRCKRLLKIISREADQILDDVYRHSVQPKRSHMKKGRDLFMQFEARVIPALIQMIFSIFDAYHTNPNISELYKHLEQAMACLSWFCDRMRSLRKENYVKCTTRSLKLRGPLQGLIAAWESGQLIHTDSNSSNTDGEVIQPDENSEDDDDDDNLLPSSTKKPFTKAEAVALISGLQRHQGPERYVLILEDFGDELGKRTIRELREQARRTHDQYTPNIEDRLATTEGRKEWRWLLSVVE